MEERSITVQRTARFYTLGDPTTATEIVLVLHGYGHLARYFLNAFHGMEDGRAIVAPEALSRFYTDGSFTRVGASWMTREDRDHEIADQIHYLDALIARMRTECRQAARVRALGFSQGVSTLCRWAMLGRTPVEHVVIWGGSMPPDLDPTRMKDRWRNTRIDLVHGIDDPVVKEDVLLRNEAAVRATGIPFNTHRFHGGHELDSVTLDRLFAP